MSSLEDTIAVDNSVRFIDAFVRLIDLKKVGFEPRIVKIEVKTTPKKEDTNSSKILYKNFTKTP